MGQLPMGQEIRGWMLALLALAGCSPSPPPALAPYALAPLKPGDGLADLQLGRTTLGDALERLGPGQVTLMAGDYTTYQLSYADGGLVLMFEVRHGPCWTAHRAMPAQQAARDLVAFVRELPACAALPLHSLAVRPPFYRGATDRGFRLGDGVNTSGVHGEWIVDGSPFMHAGIDDTPEHRADFPNGLSLFFDGLWINEGPPVRMMLISDPDSR